MAALASISCQSKINFHFRWKTVIPVFGEYLLFFQISFSELKDSKETFIFMEKNKNRKFTIFNVHGNLKQSCVLEFWLVYRIYNITEINHNSHFHGFRNYEFML